jgi:hypothetical protein
MLAVENVSNYYRWFSMEQQHHSNVPTHLIPMWMNSMMGLYTAHYNGPLTDGEKYNENIDLYYRELKNVFFRFKKELESKNLPTPSELYNI